MAKRKAEAEATAGTTAQAQDGRQLGEFELKATFKNFGFRSLVNGDKLQLIFEADWKHLPAGTMEKVAGVVQLMGELTFLKAAVQKEMPQAKELPGQHKLPLGSEEIG